MNFKLTISVSFHQVPKSNTLDYKVIKNPDNTETSTVGVYYMVTQNTFARGKVKVSLEVMKKSPGDVRNITTTFLLKSYCSAQLKS